MIVAQPLIIVILTIGVLLYFTRFRSRAVDRLIVAAIFALALTLLIRPDFATDVAHLVGVGRGVDLVFYITLPGLGFCVLLLLSKYRELNGKLTTLVRDDALRHATGPRRGDDSGS